VREFGLTPGGVAPIIPIYDRFFGHVPGQREPAYDLPEADEGTIMSPLSTDGCRHLGEIVPGSPDSLGTLGRGLWLYRTVEFVLL